MIDKVTYDTMKSAYGSVGSWAVWRMPKNGEGPTARTGDLSIFDEPDIASKLNNRFVFLGLNLSEQDSPLTNADWRNFHSVDNRRQRDYKLRYALHGTSFWRAYMTDALKGIRKTDSAEVMKWVRNNPDVVKTQMNALRKEISTLGGSPILVAMGGKCRAILSYHLADFKIVGIMHYSAYINQERYRERVLEALADQLNQSVKTPSYH